MPESPAIIVQLLGGLGNQLFQYAMGRCLAERNRAVLKLDITAFQDYTLRSYALQHFNVAVEFATPKEVAASSAIVEKGHDFNGDTLSILPPAFLTGYWQSEKYFKEIEPILRKELTLKEPLEGEDLKVARAIESCESVSLHVRRGDYVTNSHTNQFHGTCSLAYYRKCLALLRQSVRDPALFVFSDDPQWVADNMKFDLPATYVNHNPPEKHYADLRLMGLCRHNILANSSFSWWGAWLNANPSKRVYAPLRWYADYRIKTPDLIPPGWTRVDNLDFPRWAGQISMRIRNRLRRMLP